MTPGAIMSMDLAGTNSEIRTSAGPTDGSKTPPPGTPKGKRLSFGERSSVMFRPNRMRLKGVGNDS